MNSATTASTSNTFAAASAQSTAAASQTGSIVLLASVIAIVRAAMVVIAAVSLGSAARFFFPEMFAIPNNPMALLAAVAIDTFAVTTIALLARAKNTTRTKTR